MMARQREREREAKERERERDSSLHTGSHRYLQYLNRKCNVVLIFDTYNRQSSHNA